MAPAAFVAPTQATEGVPGSFNPSTADKPRDLAHLISLGRLANSVGTAWTQPGAHVVLADGSEAHWDGTTWVAGRVYAPPPTNLPAAGRTVTAGAWNGGNPGAASADDAPDAVVMQDTGDDRLWIAWNEIDDPTLYRAGTARVEVLDGSGTTVVWSTNNTAGNRISGLSVTGYQYGSNPVRIVMEYLDGTEYIVEVTT